MNGTRTGGGWGRAGGTQLRLVLVSGGSGTEREALAQQGSISSLTREEVGIEEEVRGGGGTEQAEPWWR